mgnify:CR=1 FL=1
MFLVKRMIIIISEKFSVTAWIGWIGYCSQCSRRFWGNDGNRDIQIDQYEQSQRNFLKVFHGKYTSFLWLDFRGFDQVNCYRSIVN